MIPDVRYATTPQSVHISYLVIGEGPIDIVFPGWGYSNIEYAWRILDAVGDEGAGLAEMGTRAPSEWGLRLMGASPKVVHLAGRPCSSFADQPGGCSLPAQRVEATWCTSSALPISRFLPLGGTTCASEPWEGNSTPLERLHALRDGVAGFSGPPERLDRRSPTPPPEVPQMLSVETERWAVDAARRVVEEFHLRAGRERPDWLLGGMRRAVILFDNDCGFCRWSLSKLLAWDRHGRLRPVALQSEQADDFLMGMDRERKMASWHLVAPNGRTYSGGGAVPQLARLLPAGAPIAALASAFPRTTDRAYRWVARHRERLGRVLGERACAVDPTERDR